MVEEMMEKLKTQSDFETPGELIGYEDDTDSDF
jgi:hypothetical protein